MSERGLFATSSGPVGDSWRGPLSCGFTRPIAKRDDACFLDTLPVDGGSVWYCCRCRGPATIPFPAFSSPSAGGLSYTAPSERPPELPSCWKLPQPPRHPTLLPLSSLSTCPSNQRRRRRLRSQPRPSPSRILPGEAAFPPIISTQRNRCQQL